MATMIEYTRFNETIEFVDNAANRKSLVTMALKFAEIDQNLVTGDEDINLPTPKNLPPDTMKQQALIKSFVAQLEQSKLVTIDNGYDNDHNMHDVVVIRIV